MAINYNRLRPRAVLNQTQNYAPGTFNPAIEGGDLFASGQRKVYMSDAAQQGLRTTTTRAGQTDKRNMRFANINQYAPDDAIGQPPTVLFKNRDGNYQYAQVQDVSPLNQAIFEDPNISSPERRKEIIAARAAFNEGEGGNTQYFPKALLGGYAPRKGATPNPNQAQVIPLDQPFRMGSGYPAVGGDALQMRYEMIGDPIPESRLPVRALEQIARGQAASDYYNEEATTGFFKDNNVTFAPYQTYQKGLRGQSTPIPQSLQDGQYPESVLAKLGYIRGDDGIPTKIQGTKEQLDMGLGYLYVDGKEVPLSRYNEDTNARFNIFRGVPLAENRSLNVMYPNQPTVVDIGPRKADMQGVEKELRDINYLIADHGQELGSTYYGNQYAEPGLTEIEANIRSRVNPLRFEADLNRRATYATPKDQRMAVANQKRLSVNSPSSRVPLPNLYNAPEVIPSLTGNTIADYDVIQPTYLNTNTNADDIDLFNRFTRMSSKGQSMTTGDDIDYGRKYVLSETELLNQNFGYDPRGFIAYRPGVNSSSEVLPSLGDFYPNVRQLGVEPIPQPNNPEAAYRLASVNEFGMPLYANNAYMPPSGYKNTLPAPAFVRRITDPLAKGRWIGGGMEPSLWKYGGSKLDMRNNLGYDPLNSAYQINIPKGGRYIQQLENKDPRAINARVQDLRARQEAALLPPDVMPALFTRQYNITQTGEFIRPKNVNDIVVENATIPVMKEVSKDVYEPVQMPFISNAKTLAQDLADVRVMVGNRSFPLTPEATVEPYLLSEKQQNKRFVESYRARRMGLDDDYYQLQEPSDKELEIIQSQINKGGTRGMVGAINPDDDLAALARAAKNPDTREIYADPTIEPTDTLEAIQALRRRERELNIAISRYQEPEYFDRNETALASRFGGGAESIVSQNPGSIYSRTRYFRDARDVNNNGNYIPASPSIDRFINEEEAAAIAAKANIRPAPSQQSDFTWSRYPVSGKANYEVSSQGDTRFSALNARLKDGRTIEEAYQLDVKGYRSQGDDWRLGKGKPPLNPMSQQESYQKYEELWDQWANENPELINELAQASRGKTLTDKFAATDISQARALASVLKNREGYSDSLDKSTDYIGYVSPNNILADAIDGTDAVGQRLNKEQLFAKRNQIQQDAESAQAAYNQLMGLERQPKIRVNTVARDIDEAKEIVNQLNYQGLRVNQDPADLLAIQAQGSLRPDGNLDFLPTTYNKPPVEVDPEIDALYRQDQRDLAERRAIANTLAGQLKGIKAAVGRQRLEADGLMPVPMQIPEESAMIRRQMMQEENMPKSNTPKPNTPQQMQAAQDTAEAQMRMVQDSGRTQGRFSRWTQEIPESVAAKQAEQAASSVTTEDVWSANRLRGQRMQVRLTPVDSAVYDQMIAAENIIPNLGSQALARQFQDPQQMIPEESLMRTSIDSHMMRQTPPTNYPTVEDSIRRNNEQQPYGTFRQTQGSRYQQYEPTGMTEQAQQSPEAMSMLQRYAVPLGIGGTLLGAATLNSYGQQQEQARMREEAELARMYGV